MEKPKYTDHLLTPSKNDSGYENGLSVKSKQTFYQKKTNPDSHVSMIETTLLKDKWQSERDLIIETIKELIKT